MAHFTSGGASGSTKLWVVFGIAGLFIAGTTIYLIRANRQPAAQMMFTEVSASLDHGGSDPHRQEAQRQEEERRRQAEVQAEKTRKDEAEKAWREENEREYQKMKGIVAAAKMAPLPPPPSNPLDLPAKLRTKAIIWNLSYGNDGLSGATHMLPAHIRGNSADEALALFIITKRTDVHLGSYVIKHGSGPNNPVPMVTSQAYRTDVEVRVVTWPGKTVYGPYLIAGAPPPVRIAATVSPPQPIYGDYTGTLASWVEQQIDLPKKEGN